MVSVWSFCMAVRGFKNIATIMILKFDKESDGGWQPHPPPLDGYFSKIL